MNKRLRIVIVAAAALTLLTASSQSQVTKVGTTAAKFLSIPVGARALGMGGAFVAVANDASAMYWNPAGLTNLTQSEALFNHANWLAGIGFNYGGVAMPLGDVGVVGVSFTSLTMAEMERTTESLPEGTGQTFSAGSFSVGVSYARKLTEWFSIGFNAKYINEYIWNSAANGFGFDIGTLFITPFPGLKFGAGISNFGGKMQMQGDDLLVLKDISPNNGNNPNISARLGTDRFDLPLTLRIGFSFEALATEDQQLLLVTDALHPNDNAESVNIGGEYSLFKRMLSLRAGYKSIGQRDSEEQYTFGGGLRYPVAENLIVKFDYGFERFGRLQDVHKFTIGLLF